MNVIPLFIAICIGGAVGGLLGEFVDGGLSLPHRNPDGSFDLGFLKNIALGAAAGAVSQIDALKQSPINTTVLLVASLGSLMVGIGGANWAKSKTDSKIMQGAAAVLAAKQPDLARSQQILAARSAREVMQIANDVH